jgi:hypothetical protein
MTIDESYWKRVSQAGLTTSLDAIPWTDSCLVQCLAPGTARVQITPDQRRSPNAILHRTVTWVSSGPHAAFTPFHGYEASSS